MTHSDCVADLVSARRACQRSNVHGGGECPRLIGAPPVHRIIPLLLWLISGAAVLAAVAPPIPPPPGPITPVPSSAPTLTLVQARAIAVANHPRVRAALLTAAAAGQVEREVRAAFQPSVYAAASGVDAKPNSRIAAGGLNNPLLISRIAYGLSMTQLIADFGRTEHLRRSAVLGASARAQTLEATRQDILLQVATAYFEALRAQSVLRVAQSTVRDRQLMLDQVSAMAEAKLKAGLDVSFAKVNLSDAKLALSMAQNQAQDARIRLAEAMGARPQPYKLVDEPPPGTPPDDSDALVDEALRQRPDLLSLRKERDSAIQFARAERDLSRPTVAMIGAAGVTPDRDPKRINGEYSALGINVSLPVFNGGLFAARRKEADLKARAVDQNVRALENQIVREVHQAALNARTAYERMALTKQLLAHASEALDLAQARYTQGLGSVVELNQAQLAAESAQIGDAAALYEYQAQLAVLHRNLGRSP